MWLLVEIHRKKSKPIFTQVNLQHENSINRCDMRP